MERVSACIVGGGPGGLMLGLLLAKRGAGVLVLEGHADFEREFRADGRYSAIAKLGGFTPAYEHHDFDVIWFTIEQPPGWSSTLYVSLGERMRGLLLPKYPHHVQVGLILLTGEWRRWRQEGVAVVA